MLALPVAGGLACLLLVVSYVAPVDWASGVNGVSLRRGTLQLAHASCALSPKHGAWTMSVRGGAATLLLGPTSKWRPHMSNGRVVAGVLAASVSAVFVPLWPWALVLPGIWLLGRRLFFRPPQPHECAHCGYDRRGLASESAPCPECSGVPSPSPVS